GFCSPTGSVPALIRRGRLLSVKRESFQLGLFGPDDYRARPRLNTTRDCIHYCCGEGGDISPADDILPPFGAAGCAHLACLFSQSFFSAAQASLTALPSERVEPDLMASPSLLKSANLLSFLIALLPPSCSGRTM